MFACESIVIDFGPVTIGKWSRGTRNRDASGGGIDFSIAVLVANNDAKDPSRLFVLRGISVKVAMVRFPMFKKGKPHHCESQEK